MVIRKITRKQIVDNLLDKMALGQELTQEQLDLLVEMSKSFEDWEFLVAFSAKRPYLKSAERKQRKHK